MKFLVTLLSVGIALVCQHEAAAFSFQSKNAVRPPSSLSMVKLNENAKTVKVGVIGMGRIGLVHLEAITKAPGVVPVIVSNPTVSKAEAGKNKIAKILVLSVR
jgi:phosphoglycerate dehydrogenase-like enzyme